MTAMIEILWALGGADDDGAYCVWYLWLSDTGALWPGAPLLSVHREWKTHPLCISWPIGPPPMARTSSRNGKNAQTSGEGHVAVLLIHQSVVHADVAARLIF
eukprot:9472926-Pyramimonas_sp.AAC.1